MSVEWRRGVGLQSVHGLATGEAREVKRGAESKPGLIGNGAKKERRQSFCVLAPSLRKAARVIRGKDFWTCFYALVLVVMP